MKKLLSTLFIVLLIAGCSDNPTAPEEEFDAYTVGNFRVISDSEAEYVGTNSNQKALPTVSADGDTIEIHQPGQQSLELWQDSTQQEGQFVMRFIDSTYTNANLEELPEVEVKNPKGGDDRYPLGIQGKSTSLNDERIAFIPDMIIYCGYEAGFESNNPKIFITFRQSDQSLLRTYVVFVDGILEASKDIAC